MNFHYLLLAPSNTTSRTSPHHHLHDGVYLALYPTVHKDNPVNYIQRSKSSVPFAKNISISAQVDECGRVQQNAASSFCQKIRYELQKYRTHPDKSVLSLPYLTEIRSIFCIMRSDTVYFYVPILITVAFRTYQP